MLNQTTHQIDLTMWTSTTQSHRETMKYDNVYQRRIYWDLNKAIIMMLTVITLILGVVGNVMIILTVCIRRLMHNPMSYYLANLAVVYTLLSLVVCPLLTFHVLRDAHFRREVCASFYILLYSLALLVAFAVLTIGVDRVWKERWGWHYLSRHSGRLALAVVAACWVTALALVTTLELTDSVQHPLRGHLCPGGGGGGGGASQPHPTAAPGDIAMEVIFYTCYGAAFVSLVIVQIMYGRKIRKTGHLPGGLTGDALVQVPEKEAAAVREAGGRQAPRLDSRLYEDGDQAARSVHTLLLLVCVHTVCWLPFYVLYSLNAHGLAAFVPHHVVEIIHYLALLSSPLNTLLLYFSSVEFNMMMRQLLGAMCCRAVRLPSGSTVTLEWEPLHQISDDQVEAFNDDATRLAVGMATPSPSAGLKPPHDDAAVSVGSSVGDRSVHGQLHEIAADTAGPSAQLYDWQHLPPPSPQRHRRQPSDDRLVDADEADFLSSPMPAAVGGGSSLAPTPTMMLTPAPDALSRAGHWHGDSSGSVSLADSQHSARRSHRVLASLKNLFRHGLGSRGRPDSSHPGSAQPTSRGHQGSAQPASRGHQGFGQPASRGRPGSSQSGSAAATPDHAEQLSFAARVAALWHRRRIGPWAGGSSSDPSREPQQGPRTASEASLVRRLVLAGLPSGVVAGRGRRVSGVWRSPGGRAHRLDPRAEEYPALLERIAATDSGYRTPAGQPIHHVCARHHVHGRCHHHDVRRQVAPPSVRPRQQTSVGNWTMPALAAQQPRRLPPPPVPPRLDGASSSDSEGEDAVKRITNL